MRDDFDRYARFYDLDYGDLDADLLLIEQFAARCGSPILELACGTGRVLLPLARQGYQVTGVDISPAMLAIARRKLAAEGLEGQVTLVQQDLCELALDGRFNLAVIALNSFMHLPTRDEQLAALVCVHQHLQPGGLLYLDVLSPDMARLLDSGGQIFLDKTMTDPETGHQLLKLSSQRVDQAQQRIDVTWVVDEVDGERGVWRTIFPFSMRYLFRSELELLLQRAGFEVEAVYGSYDLDEFDDGSEKMITIARRPDLGSPEGAGAAARPGRRRSSTQEG